MVKKRKAVTYNKPDKAKLLPNNYDEAYKRFYASGCTMSPIFTYSGPVDELY